MESKNKKCQNCGAAEFYTRSVQFAGDASGALPVGFWGSGDLRLRVCGDCGLAQWFLPQASLEKIKEKYQREP